jgi:heme-degrading monooxygenase HmoA
MHARVSQYYIRPGKMDEFAAVVDSLIPALHKVAGFRSLLILRGGEPNKPEATAISLWDTVEELRAGDNNVFYYQVLARLMACCDGFPSVREHEVLVSEIPLR